MTVYVRMRRIRFSNGGTTSTLLGTTTFPFTNYTTSHPLKPKSFLKLLPSRTPLFTSPHYRLVTTAQHHSSSTSHILPTPQTNNLSGGDGQNGYPLKDSKVVLKGMTYTDLEKWVQSHGYRPAQALMLWKCLYGDNIWAQCSEELEGLNKDFRKMLSEHTEFKKLNLKEILTASDGTKKDLTDVIQVRRWSGNRNCSNTL
ncbi:hypothetical protein K7X08_006379 [Anisodus acutangulus]|uniref:Uncharacterized protein n=1 Tax=Anisodus acutangulus TaxID=402998 RepID=A0A9Q1RNU2_9SOLA|nr:hypothetical protein K7X08_006379 [Anisodus acutangulus]